MPHIPSGGGDVDVFVHLLTCLMLCSTRLLDMITHIFGWGDVNVFVHLLTCSILRSTRLLDVITHTFGRGVLTSFMLGYACLLDMIVHAANIFHATLHMPSLHDCT